MQAQRAHAVSGPAASRKARLLVWHGATPLSMREFRPPWLHDHILGISQLTEDRVLGDDTDDSRQEKNG
ncbi:hypothetical protein GCM10023335_54670 [Streptomyces siamensis]|uniref:Uncharacterized protein n=1 Tax=Streptomyces siamensis TaxID=1274986 RepID=A0ABP9J6X4_9ACTN